MSDDKKAAKELKAQRRAAKVAEKQATLPPGAAAEAQQAAAATAAARKAEAAAGKKPAGPAGKPVAVPVSVSAPAAAPIVPAAAIASTASAPTEQNTKEAPVRLRDSLFSHLEQRPLLTSEYASRDIHPATISLALRYSHGQCIGSNTRCMAMLECFKVLIADYVTPQGTTLSRNLSPYLSTQISFLITARPLSVSMGTAIRLLKQAISTRDIDKPDDELKEELFQFIDTFQRERITVAGQVIVKLASPRIVDGDVVLVYAYSTIVEKILLAVAEQGTRFSIVIVDSRPTFEGRRLLERLVDAKIGYIADDEFGAPQRGIPLTYVLLTGLTYALKPVTKCLLGAHAVLANGAVYSRAGTALVSMACYEAHVPVMVACETYKFAERVQLDSFVINELGSTAGMALPSKGHANKASSTLAAGTAASSAPSGKGKPPGKDDSKAAGSAAEEDAANREDDAMSQVQKLNLMFDVTPARYITLCMSELGSLPTTSVPAALREQNRNVLV